MKKVLVMRCPCGAVRMKSVFPIYGDDPDGNKEIIDMLVEGYIPSVEELGLESNNFSPHKENCDKNKS